MKSEKQEVLSEIEFNGMVATLKRVSQIATELNTIRKYNRSEDIFECLLSLYFEIYPDMTKDERKDSKALINSLRAFLRAPDRKIKHTFIMNKLYELESMLRHSAKIHGFFTKSVKQDRVKTLE